MSGEKFNLIANIVNTSVVKYTRHFQQRSSAGLVLSYLTPFGFRDSSAQNHFGPGLLGPDVSAHFSIRDCSAHFSGTARPMFLFFIYHFGGWGGGNLLFYSVYVHQNKIQETLFNVTFIFRQGNREII